MTFFGLNCFLFAVILYKLHECRALASNPGQLNRSILSVCLSLYILWLLLMILVRLDIGQFTYERGFHAAYYTVAFILEAVFAWILVDWDLSNFTLHTAVINNQVEMIGLDPKGNELFKFLITQEMLHRHPHLATFNSPIKDQIRETKKKRLGIRWRSASYNNNSQLVSSLDT